MNIVHKPRDDRLANHFHLLIREREDTIGNVVKRIASS